MKIKRFFENEVQGPEGVTDLVNDISKERVDQIVKELGSISATYGDKLTTLKKFEEELSKYKCKSNKYWWRWYLFCYRRSYWLFY